MSNEPMLSEPTTLEPAPSGPAPLTSGRSADAQLVLAAIDRLEAASRSDRVTLDRLHAELAATARTIAQAKIAMRSGAVKPDTVIACVPLDVAALLDELERRVDAMLEIGSLVRREKDAPAEARTAADQPLSEPPADEAPETAPAHGLPADVSDETAARAPQSPAPQAEPERVPTVSGVVSRLGRAGDWPPEEMDFPSSDSGGSASSASMLEAMVLALSALDGASHPEAEARTADEAERRAAEKAAREDAAATDESVQLADAALTPRPAATIMPDNELMTNFARMEAFPIPPPETGAAVIFAACEPEAAADATPAPETAEALPADAPEADAQAVPAPPSPTLPEAEQTQPGQPAAAAPPAPATSAEPNSSDDTAPSAARPDPLAPLNAMSDAEKIALFS